MNFMKMLEFINYETVNETNDMYMPNGYLKQILQYNLNINLDDTKYIMIRYDDSTNMIAIHNNPEKYGEGRKMVDIALDPSGVMNIVFFTGKLRSIGRPRSLTEAGVDSYLVELSKFINQFTTIMIDLKVPLVLANPETALNNDLIKRSTYYNILMNLDPIFLANANGPIRELFSRTSANSLRLKYPRFTKLLKDNDCSSYLTKFEYYATHAPEDLFFGMC